MSKAVRAKIIHQCCSCGYTTSLKDVMDDHTKCHVAVYSPKWTRIKDQMEFVSCSSQTPYGQEFS